MVARVGIPLRNQLRGWTDEDEKVRQLDHYLDDQPAKNRSIIRALRRFVKRVEPGLEDR
jgi:hypothetical protein